MDKNKNILFITNLHLWSLEKGKGGRAFINTVEGYLKADWNVWFITTGGGVPENLLIQNQLFENSYPTLDKWYRSGNKVLSVCSRFIKQYLIHKFYIKEGNEILKNNIGKSFIIYSYEVHGVKAGKYLSKKYNLPFVTRFQGTVHSDTSNTLVNQIKKSPHLNAYGTNANVTIMTNDGTKGKLVLERFNNRSEKVLFWRNGVNKVSLSLLSNREILRNEYNFGNSFVFLTVSRLVNWKRVDRAINGFSKLIKLYPNSKLVIIGDGAELDNLKELADKTKVLDKVDFLGAKPQSEIYNYMIASDVFLSLYDLSNVGNPLMEAMMCKKPIITIDVGDTKELIKNEVNGILLSPTEIDLLPQKMYELIEDVEKRIRISNQAYNDANKEFWDWDERIIAEISEVGKLIRNE